MILKRGGRYGVRVYRDGRQEWIGTYSTRREAKAAERRALDADSASMMTVAEFVPDYLARYERERKDSSYDTAKSSLVALQGGVRRAHARVGRAPRGDLMGGARPAVAGADRRQRCSTWRLTRS